MGTNFSYGEDITLRGHNDIYDVTEVVLKPGQPLIKNVTNTKDPDHDLDRYLYHDLELDQAENYKS